MHQPYAYNEPGISWGQNWLHVGEVRCSATMTWLMS